jgi:hypothetical protein
MVEMGHLFGDSTAGEPNAYLATISLHLHTNNNTNNDK